MLALARIRVPRLSPIGNRRNRPAAGENAANFFRSSARAHSATSALKAADTLGSACPAETALTPVGRLDAMRKRLAAVRAATAAIRPALAHFYEALDQGKLRFAGMS